MALIIERLAGLIAPVLCHMAEDIWQNIPYRLEERSVFLRGWPSVPESWRDDTLMAPVQQLRDLRASVNKVLEDCRSRQELGASLEAAVRLTPEQRTAVSTGLAEGQRTEVDDLRDWLPVSQLQLEGNPRKR